MISKRLIGVVGLLSASFAKGDCTWKGASSGHARVSSVGTSSITERILPRDDIRRYYDARLFQILDGTSPEQLTDDQGVYFSNSLCIERPLESNVMYITVGDMKKLGLDPSLPHVIKIGMKRNRSGNNEMSRDYIEKLPPYLFSVTIANKNDEEFAEKELSVVPAVNELRIYFPGGVDINGAKVKVVFIGVPTDYEIALNTDSATGKLTSATGEVKSDFFVQEQIEAYPECSLSRKSLLIEKEVDTMTYEAPSDVFALTIKQNRRRQGTIVGSYAERAFKLLGSYFLAKSSFSLENLARFCKKKDCVDKIKEILSKVCIFKRYEFSEKVSPNRKMFESAALAASIIKIGALVSPEVEPVIEKVFESGLKCSDSYKGVMASISLVSCLCTSYAIKRGDTYVLREIERCYRNIPGLSAMFCAEGIRDLTLLYSLSQGDSVSLANFWESSGLFVADRCKMTASPSIKTVKAIKTVKYIETESDKKKKVEEEKKKKANEQSFISRHKVPIITVTVCVIAVVGYVVMA